MTPDCIYDVLGFDPLGFVEEARAHMKDMPRVIQRDYLAAALDKIEHAAKVLEREITVEARHGDR